LFKGPGTYIPRVEEEVLRKVEARITLKINSDIDAPLQREFAQVEFNIEFINVLD
jgi:hypothetical protein